MKYFIYVIILIITFLSFSCRKDVTYGIKGYIYDKETLKPAQNVKITFWFSSRFGSPILEEEVVSDSLGYFDIPPYEKNELFIPMLERDGVSLCIDCIVTLEKKGFMTDSISLNWRNIDDTQYNYYVIDSLFFSAKK